MDTPTSRRRPKRAVRILWRVFFIGFGLFAALVTALFLNLFGDMPPTDAYENPSAALASEVMGADGTVMGRYYVQDRSTSTYEEISSNVINALIATEDARFDDHSGVDGIAVLRAVFLLGSQGGGSTLTQQLAKNLFGRERPSLIKLPYIKLREWVMAVKLERNLTKREIITLYLNTVPFPDNVYGIKNAALTFYGKGADKLSVDEAAVLIGTLKGNTFYNPRTHPDRALDRRNTVLDQMVKYERLSESEAATLRQRPIVLKYKKIDYHEGLAPYFRQVVEQEVKKICRDLKKPNGEPYDIYKDGLKIYTTIDPKMQAHAEASVDQHIRELQRLFTAQSGYGASGTVWKGQDSVLARAMRSSERYRDMKADGATDAQIKAAFKQPTKMRVFAWNDALTKDTVMSPLDSIKYMKMFVQTGFLAMDPVTGEVKAWVGGINHDYFQYDHVNVRATRQVGSTIKPLLYCLAVTNGYSPCANVSCAPQSFPTRKYYNAGGAKFGSTTMKKALALSINNAALYLLKQVGFDAFADFLHKAGITAKVEKVPAMALGVADISLFEMLGAYTMFPANGLQTQPYFIAKIEDRHGNLLKSFAPKQQELISPQTAFKMVRMMRGTVDFGTAKRLRYRYGFKVDAAGKTGTTNGQADGWFIGYTPQLLAGVWVGCDDRFLRFRSEALGQGAAAALPIWAYFMKRVYADKSLGYDAKAEFVEPENFDDCDVADQTSLDRSSTYWSSGPGYGGNTSSGSTSTGTEGSTDGDPTEEDVNNDADMEF